MNETDKIIIRNTVPDDLDKIVVLEKNDSQFVQEYSKAEHQNIIEEEQHLSIFEKKSEALIGYIILAGIFSKNKIIEFRRIVVSKKGLGYGKDAIRLIKQICFTQLKAKQIWLDVYEDNLRAIKLYQSLGFKKDKVKTINGRKLWIMSLHQL
ncbi:GNAT family N-acetyltransferase [Hyunsoonleella pacifica]|uniref:GNAT family N-acetyltransferase n=1 Tax=Hyunsoonleella pacifica TaxID=1080224 RepID=A0A4Q9FPA9_9FLAO|nr:GNAT family N-acetyltransferase [Hyunsoonleella pacifica]TBN14499.1 GNAT family N-acetyltransferase [Hyunsoonleella pacifica]GGD14260.1 hypothetical protein GCM10011368_15280 [Hyunsoonleella pacifica]